MDHQDFLEFLGIRESQDQGVLMVKMGLQEKKEYQVLLGQVDHQDQKDQMDDQEFKEEQDKV